MRREEISDALDMLDEDMLSHTELIRRRSGVPAGRSWKRWGAIAACLCAICTAAVIIQPAFSGEKGDNWHGVSLSVPVSVAPQATRESETKEKFVAVSSLLADTDSDTWVEQVEEYADVPVGQYTGRYTRVLSVRSDVLSESTGADISGEGRWYQISGHSDLQYLIRKERKEYSLWKFRCFNSSKYSYRDVLQQIYKIDSANKIISIQVMPAEIDNSDEGKRIQDEIGTHKITDRNRIETMYQVLSAMTCYGEGNWDMIDYGNPEMAVGGEGGSHNAVKLGRYLAFVTEYGNSVDGLKYTAVSDMFYEFGGIAYNRLGKKQAKKVQSILGIQ